MSDPVAIGLRIRARRRELKMTLKGVAGRVGCCFGFVSDVETGNRRPGYETAAALASVLGMDLDELCAAWSIVPADVAALVTRSADNIRETRSLLGQAVKP